jgi:hypothetical protein
VSAQQAMSAATRSACSRLHGSLCSAFSAIRIDLNTEKNPGPQYLYSRSTSDLSATIFSFVHVIVTRSPGYARMILLSVSRTTTRKSFWIGDLQLMPGSAPAAHTTVADSVGYAGFQSLTNLLSGT